MHISAKGVMDLFEPSRPISGERISSYESIRMLVAVRNVVAVPHLDLPTAMFRLLLLCLGLLSLSLRPLLPHTHKSGLAPRISQLPVRTALDSLRHVTLLDLAEAMLETDTTINWQNRTQSLDTVLGGGEILLLRVETLVLAGFAGEQDEALAVFLEAFDIEGEGFGGMVLTAGVDGDADCGG